MAAPTSAPRSSKHMRRGSCRRLLSGPSVSLCVGMCGVGCFARQARGLDQIFVVLMFISLVSEFMPCVYRLVLISLLFSFAANPPLIHLSVHSFSFRFICQHSTNIPEVRGHALYHGQDPCPWGSPGSALHRLWVSYSQISQNTCSLSAAYAQDTHMHTKLNQSFNQQYFVANLCRPECLSL